MSDAETLYLWIRGALQSLEHGDIVDINDLGFILVSRGNERYINVPEGKLAVSVIEPLVLTKCVEWVRKEGYAVELWGDVKGFLLITPKT